MVKLGMVMMVNQQRGSTTPDALGDSYPEYRIGSSDSNRSTYGYAIAVGIQEHRKSSAGRQVEGLAETTSCRSGRVAFLHDVFVPSSSPLVCFQENDARFIDELLKMAGQ
jgi:hypothetical protein